MTRKAKEGDVRSEQGVVSKYSEVSGRFEPIEAREQYLIEQRRIRRSNRGSSSFADWREADPAGVFRLVCTVSRLGFAVQFGYTRDGGAFAIRIVGDGEPFTEFVRPSEDINLFLANIAGDYENAPDNDFAAARHV